MKLVLVLVLLSIGYVENLKEEMQQSNVSCITPNNTLGKCIKIHKCSVFVQAMRARKNETFDFIRASQCGHDDEDSKQPKVCCGTHNDYLYKTTSNTSLLRTNLFPKSCGIQNDYGNRIFGGITAQLGEFPWMARLRHRRNDDGLFSYGCVGFLISKTFVLTAAHCIRSKVLEALGPIYQVQLGEHNTDTDPDCQETFCTDAPQLLETAEPIVHPEYSGDKNLHNDIAIVPLKNPANFTEFVFPLCLSKNLSQEPMLWISGWGRTETNKTSATKLKTNVPRMSKVQCINLFKPIGITIMDSQICAGGETGHDSCSGDSGGPLMVLTTDFLWYAEGIVSFGKNCGEKGWPGVYTSIPYYVPWIEKVMNQYLMENEEVVNMRSRIATEEPLVTWSL